MYKKRSLFITFEGIEGSGKSFQSKKLYKNIKSKKIPVILTREPGGTKSAEKIRRVILDDYFGNNNKIKFDKYTDTLLYLAARNEHLIDKIIPALSRKKVVICDRFIDSTLAYQVNGKKVSRKLVDTIHKYILRRTKPDLTFILKVNINKAMKRINKRKTKNRYDKFSKNFYSKVQNSFLRLAKNNKSRYFVIDNSSDSSNIEKIIFNKFSKVFSR